VLFYASSCFINSRRSAAPVPRNLAAALFTTIGLDLLQRAFVLYTKNIANFNALYGTFGSVVALLMWIYLSGALIILGGCLAAAQYEIRMSWRINRSASGTFKLGFLESGIQIAVRRATQPSRARRLRERSDESGESCHEIGARSRARRSV